MWGSAEGREPKREPLDLDIYVDSSGSMVDPRRTLSLPTLAGAIICLSALRAGARVQATLWSGAQQFSSTPGFVRDEHAVLGVLTGYFGGATAFPIHVLRDTLERRRRAREQVAAQAEPEPVARVDGATKRAVKGRAKSKAARKPPRAAEAAPAEASNGDTPVMVTREENANG